ncbi:MAG: hypothetical protein AB1489_35110, partial [Acidobacteriota bacterium]
MSVCPKCNTSYTGTLKFCSLDGVPLINCSEEVYLSLGSIINDSLSVIARLRTDSLGVIYQVADKIVTGRVSCLRLFHPGVTTQATFSGLEQLGALLREWLDCSDITTNYIPIELEDGRTGLLSDFCAGVTFDDALTREAPLPPQICASLLLSLAEILKTAHLAGFVHGSLTPENILVTEYHSKKISEWPNISQLKLIDFSIGRIIVRY